MQLTNRKSPNRLGKYKVSTRELIKRALLVKNTTPEFFSVKKLAPKIGTGIYQASFVYNIILRRGL